MYIDLSCTNNVSWDIKMKRIISEIVTSLYYFSTVISTYLHFSKREKNLCQENRFPLQFSDSKAISKATT